MEAKLVLDNEVTVQINGLDLPTRKKLHEKFKFEIPGARYQPSVRLGRWDGKKSFFSLGGLTYQALLPEILTELDNMHCDISLIDNRAPKPQFVFPEIKEDMFSDRVWPENHPQAGKPVMFRDYQIEILKNYIGELQSIQEVATGAGKTLMTAGMSLLVEEYGRSVVIVPNKSLVAQTEEDYRNLGLDVGVYFGDRKEGGRKHTICTWQSLNILMKNSEGRSSKSEPASYRLLKDPTDFLIDDFVDDVVCVIVDEAHMAKADVLTQMLTGIFGNVPIRWGLTGTIPLDKIGELSLYCSIGNMVGKLSAKELQDAGHLANCHVNIVQMVDHVEYKEYQAELKYLTENTERVAYVARLADRVSKTGNTLILVDRIATGKLLQAELSSLFSLLGDKPDITFVSGAMKGKTRKEEYDSMASSTSKITIATYGVAAVGINVPRIFNLVLFEPGKSFVRVIQSIGRGLRKAQDKDAVNIWDITSTCKFSKRHLTARKKFYTSAQYPFTIEKAVWQ
jgi:superfamily II DNA or RNA helicase